MKNIRELSDQGIIAYYQAKDADYISNSVPHFRASALPFASLENSQDTVTHISFLNNLDYDGPKTKNPYSSLHCARKIIFSVLNVPEHPIIESSVADKRNFMRGEIAEIRELEHVARGLKENQKIIYQKGFFEKPPDELKIEPESPYGLPITGRCDGLVYEDDVLQYIAELKAPRYMNWTYKVENRPKYLGDKNADSPINSKPSIEHALQLGMYKFKKKTTLPDYLYYIYDSGSEFALFDINFTYKNEKIFSLDVRNVYDEKVYRFLWARLETGLKNATKIVNETLPLLLETPDIHALLLSVDCLPAKKFQQISELEYPCYAKSGFQCQFLPYCFPDLFENGVMHFDKENQCFYNPLEEWQKTLRDEAK